VRALKTPNTDHVRDGVQALAQISDDPDTRGVLIAVIAQNGSVTVYPFGDCKNQDSAFVAATLLGHVIQS